MLCGVHRELPELVLHPVAVVDFLLCFFRGKLLDEVEELLSLSLLPLSLYCCCLQNCCYLFLELEL